MTERNPNWPACWREASATYNEARDEIRVVVVVDASALGEADAKASAAGVSRMTYQAALEAAYARGVAHGRAAAKGGDTWG